ncbi:MAG: hypothetical protein DRP96_07435, partial [Candidatus Neomarinimicrobiota bacterium]
SAVIAGSDLIFHNGFTIDLGDNYSQNGQLVLPSNSGFSIILDSAFIEFSWIRGNGNKLTLQNESALNSQVHIQDAVLTGIVNIDGYFVTFEGNSVVLEDTLQNASNTGRDLVIKGLFTNRGVIRDNPVGYPSYLWIDITGDIVNSGQWTNSKTTLNGTLNQTVTLSNNEIIYADFILEAVMGTGGYQWYKNGAVISGENNNNLFLNSLEPGNIYYCSTNEGNSRTISVIGDDIGPADWKMIAALPSSVRDIHFIDNLVGFAVGGGSIYSNEGGGKVYKTVDGGNNWLELSLPADPPFSSIFFTDPMNGWVVGGRTSECRIFHTSNGGTDWTEQVSAVSNRPTSIFFANASNGWITNDAGKIQHTSNGGTTWSVQNSTISEHVTDIFFVDENTGWAGAQYATILHTTDGGDTWNAQNSTIPRPSFDNRNFGFMDFIDENTGWICGDNGWIVNTSDGGTNWTLQETPADGIHLCAIDFIDASDGFAVGSMGTVLKTSDGGATWERSAFSNSNWLSDICFINDSTVFISDGEGNIYKYSQESAPELLADFAANINSGPVPLTVQFSDLSSGTPISWNWDFGDGNSATQQNPQHTYETAGTYSVSLTVSDGNTENTHIKTDYITVLEPIDEPDGWFLQNPYPVPDDLYSLNVLDANTAVAVGQGGTIIKTTDAGATWSILNSGTSVNLNDVYFPSMSTGYAVGNNPAYGEPGTVLKTTDSGDTWDALSISINYDMRGVFFIDENTGWIVGDGSYGQDGTVIKTINGGDSWTKQSSNIDGEIRAVFFLDSNIGWIGGEGYCALTTDGGSTWTPVDITTEDYQYVKEIQFLDANNGWIAASTSLYQTTDGGNIWTAVVPASDEYYSSVYFSDANTGWASSEEKVFKTIDGGSTWTEQIDLPGYGGYDIESLDFSGSTGWFAGTEGIIYQNTDGSWTEMSSSIFPDTHTDLKDLFFVDENTGWIVGAVDNIWKTNDGGHSWIEQTGEFWTVYDVDFVDASNGWAVGDGPYNGDAKIYHTTDGGTNWTEQTSGTENWFAAVDFIDTNNGWAVGYAGTILHTSDGGSNWSEQSSGTGEYLNDVIFLDSQTGWVCGTNGIILHTTDGGTNWSQQTNSNDNNLYSMYFLDSNHGFAVGAEITILETTDGGSAWNEITTGSYTDPSYNSITFADQLNGWIVGDNGTLLTTTDGGSTWTEQINPTGVDLESVFFVNPTTGWAVGDNGAILKTSTAGEIPVAINEPDFVDTEPQKYMLPQNYPNPFNPTTTIRYGLPETGQVRMTIFNLYGQKVVDLVNTTQNPGYYETIWNGKNRDGVSVSSGVYICYINVVGRTESYSKNIKMLLMK